MSQPTMSAATHYELNNTITLCEEQLISSSLVQDKLGHLPIYKVDGRYCLSGIIRFEPSFDYRKFSKDFYFGKPIGNIITVKIPLQHLSKVNQLSGIYFEIAQRIQADNQKMVADTRADSVWKGINLPKSYTGKNVLIGITDWGFDYTHPMFMDTSLSKTRIRAAWDHFKMSGKKPQGFDYGVSYETPMELDAAQSDTAGTYYSYATHGSHVAGIAGGSGAGIGYRGVAFEAEYLFNSIQLDAGAAIDAFTWMKQIADKDKKRLVINMSWGLYYIGTMDGKSLLSQAIDAMSKQGVVFVTSGGNNGNVNFHIKYTHGGDSIRTKINFYSYAAHPKMWGQSISMWGEVGKSFGAGFEVYNSSNVKIGSSKVYETNKNTGYIDSVLVIGSDSIFYNFSLDGAHPLNNRPQIRMRIKNTNTNLSIVMVSGASGGGTVHYWNLVELSNGVGNWGLAFTPFGSPSWPSDANYSIGEPASTSSAIAVAAHISETVLSNGNLNPGNRATFSSKGPTYDERMKPDISAPGSNVISAINSFTTENFTSVANTNFRGRSYHFAAFSGTSMASPAAAGVVALMLEANPTLTPKQIMEILKATARQDNRTGVIGETGSSLWGFGKVTATRAIALAVNTVSLNESYAFNNVLVYPNPVKDKCYLSLENGQLAGVNITVMNTLGQTVHRQMYVNDGAIDLSSLSPGIYFFEIKSESRTYLCKILKE